MSETVATIDATFESTIPLEVELDVVNQSSCGENKIFYGTTEYWNSRATLITKKGYIYIYSDHKQIDNKDIVGIKVGDGTSYLIDMPFIDKPLDEHTADTVKHVTAQEKEFWNGKVRCFVDPENEENLIFSTQ